MKKNFLTIVSMLAVMPMVLCSCGSNGNSNQTTAAADQAAATEKADLVSGSGEAEVTMRLGHVVADGSSLDKGLDKLAELVKEKSGGSMALEVYPNSQLGDNTAMAEQLQFGSMDMMAPSIAALSGFSNSTAVFDLPYLFKNEAAAEETLDGEVGNKVADSLRTSGFEVLGWMTQSWRNVTCNKEVHAPGDMKGIKIRTMDSAYHIAHFNALGASAIPMAMSEVYTAIQQGTIDAQENPYTNIVTSRFYEVQDYVIETRHIYDACPVIISSITWNKLDSEQQEILKDAVKEAVDWERAEVAKDDEENKKIVTESGTIVVDLTDEERAKFREAAQPVYDTYLSDYGEEGQTNLNTIEAINEKH